jgi:hypothetical protein
VIGWRRFVPRSLWRSERLRRELERLSGGAVLGGPFAGLRDLRVSFGSELDPKRLGTYELEIRAPLEAAIARRPEVVLVIGAAEGYYAVGLALRLPESRIVAFEARAEGREEIARLARANGVEARIEIRGLCDIPALGRALAAGRDRFVLCDVDGAEGLLLDPGIVPALSATEILVETHDAFVPGTEDLLRSKFAASHRIDEVRQRPRSWDDAPRLELPRAFEGALVQAMNERRPEGNHWLHLIPR